MLMFAAYFTADKFIVVFSFMKASMAGAHPPSPDL